MDEKSPKSAADKKAERSNVIEEQIRQQQKRKEERAFLEELGKRVHMAREGKNLSEKGKFSSALVAYRRFLSITARAVSVEVEELRPQLFDERTRRGESLLISSILFDMLKILDKINSASAKEERRTCHRLFIRFTVNQPFQMFAAENLRKYLVYRKSVMNKSEFWATYQAIKVKRFCAVATWAYDSANCGEVRTLRQFRDHTLARSVFGRAFVNLYYRHGSQLTQVLHHVPGAKFAARKSLGWVVRLLPQASP